VNYNFYIAFGSVAIALAAILSTAFLPTMTTNLICLVSVLLAGVALMLTIIKRNLLDTVPMKPLNGYYTRMVVSYSCGCSWTNDLWEMESDCDKHCSEHSKPAICYIGTGVKGVRPSHGETVKSELVAKIEQTVDF